MNTRDISVYFCPVMKNFELAIEICKQALDFISNERYITNENSFPGGGISGILRPSSVGTINASQSLVGDCRELTLALFNNSLDFGKIWDFI